MEGIFGFDNVMAARHPLSTSAWLRDSLAPTTTTKAELTRSGHAANAHLLAPAAHRPGLQAQARGGHLRLHRCHRRRRGRWWPERERSRSRIGRLSALIRSLCSAGRTAEAARALADAGTLRASSPTTPWSRGTAAQASSPPRAASRPPSRSRPTPTPSSPSCGGSARGAG